MEAQTMKRWDIINTLLSRCEGKRYLEIGLNRGECFDRVKCDYKISVDPDPKCHASFCMTSDEFFHQYEGNRFSVIFLDGLHHSSQLSRDITNAFEWLEPNGFIVCHDCNPTKEEEQRVPRETKRWNGDVWKSICAIRNITDINIMTVNTDEGCAILTKRKDFESEKIFIRESDMQYRNLEAKRKWWLNLVDVSHFIKIYG